MSKITKKQQQIIDTAVKLFLQYGYHQVSVDKISEVSNVTKMTIYKYFESKEKLFEVALTKRNNGFIEDLLRCTSEPSEATEKLKSIFSFYNEWFNSEEFCGCLFINSLHVNFDTDKKVTNFIKQNKVMTRQIIESILCFLFESDEKSKMIASQIIKLLDGAIISAQLGLEDNPAQNAWIATVALLRSESVEIENDFSL